MTILQMIAEWRKGCSHSTEGHPELCHACTRALIDAVEKRAESDAEDLDMEWVHRL